MKSKDLETDLGEVYFNIMDNYYNNRNIQEFSPLSIKYSFTIFSCALLNLKHNMKHYDNDSVKSLVESFENKWSNFKEVYNETV